MLLHFLGDTTMAGDNIGYGDLSPARTSASAVTTGGVAGVNKLWLPLWSGELMHAYDQYNIFENLIGTKSLVGGTSWEFPITGTVGLVPSWNAGVELTAGVTTASTTFKVNLDPRPMAAHFETDNIDLLITQWDYRNELARQAGLTLANARDKQIISTLIAAAVVPQIGTDTRSLTFPAPAVVDVTQAAIGVAVSTCTQNAALLILQAIENYLVTMQENNYPNMDVYCAVPPKVFQVIRALGIPRTDAAFTNQPLFTGGQAYGGQGMTMDGGMNNLSDTLEYMGVKICKTNHIPRATVAAGAAKYNLTCGTVNIFGIIFQKEAVAGLSLMGMKVDTVQDVRRNTQFTVASMMKGTGILRPELCQLLVGTTNDAARDATGEVDDRTELATAFGVSGGWDGYAVTA